jgi:hypothetical protein
MKRVFYRVPRFVFWHVSVTYILLLMQHIKLASTWSQHDVPKCNLVIGDY